MKWELRLAAGVCVGMTLCCSALPAQSRLPAPQGDERILFIAANRERVARRLPPLHWDDGLAHAARAHAQWMANWGAISHQFGGEPGLSDRVSHAGVKFTFVAENVGIAGGASELHGLWMASPGHRANLLDKRAGAVGIAVIRRGIHDYAVEDFAALAPSLSLDEQEHEVGALLAARGLRLRGTTRADRETCSLSRGVAPGVHPRYLVRYFTLEIQQLPPELLEEMAHGSYRTAAVGACEPPDQDGFAGYRLAVLLY